MDDTDVAHVCGCLGFNMAIAKPKSENYKLLIRPDLNKY